MAKKDHNIEPRMNGTVEKEGNLGNKKGFFSSTNVFSSKMKVQIDKYIPLKADAADAEKPSTNH